jgi:hypothetical protein
MTHEGSRGSLRLILRQRSACDVFQEFAFLQAATTSFEIDGAGAAVVKAPLASYNAGAIAL